MISALLGVDQPVSAPVYGFVIDTTGSMSDVIDGVKQGIQKKIDELVAGKAGADADQQFMLITLMTIIHHRLACRLGEVKQE